MSAIAPSAKGWCPGALRPMETGDGLLARVRASAGRLSLDQAAAIADAAIACGNGALEPLRARQSSIARLERADPARSARAPRRRRPPRRGPRGRAPAQHRRQPARRYRRRGGVRPRARRGRARTAAGGRRAVAATAGEVRLRPRRPRPPACRRHRRGHPVRGRRERRRGGVRRLSRRRGRACRERARAAETGEAAARLAWLFSRSPAPARARRDGCARWSSASAPRLCSPRPDSRRRPADAIATPARRSAIFSGTHAFGGVDRRRRGGRVRRHRGETASRR